MKLKLKLDKNTILEFLFQNGEKIAFGVVGLVFLLIVYFALAKAGRLDETPEKLQSQVANAQSQINAASADPSKIVVENYVAQVSRTKDPLKEKPYSTPVTWDNPVFSRRPLRDAPPLFAVQQLRGAAALGAFQGAGGAAAGGQSTGGNRWIVLTGVVPIEKQEAAYVEAFRQSVSYDQQNDHPVYLGYFVQRLEADRTGAATDADWEKVTPLVSTKEIEAATKEWSSSREREVVAPKYVENKLVFPLGPLAGRKWDASVAHEPEVPLVEKATPGQSPNEHKTPEQPSGDKVAPAKDNNPFGSSEPQPKDARPSAPDKKTSPDDEKTAPEYKLFRFFDFNVEPGKQYVYRIQLALSKPNKSENPAHLKNPDLAGQPFLRTKWSEPSSPISVPYDTRVLAVSVKASAHKEPSCQVLVVKWVQKTGQEIPKEFSVVRGQVANFSEKPAAGAAAGAAKENFISNAAIVDFRGGEPPGRKTGTLAPVGEILVLGPDGSLIMRNELDDATARQALTAAQEPLPAGPPKAATPAPGGHGRGALDAIVTPDNKAKKKPAPKGH